MKQYLKFRSVYGESFSEIERITHTLESDVITPVSVLDYEGKPIMTRGNISMITGLSKIENSSFVKALAVSYFKGERGKLLRPFSSSSAMYIDSEKTAAELCTLSDDIRKCATEVTGYAPIGGLSMFKSADAETPESLLRQIVREESGKGQNDGNTYNVTVNASGRKLLDIIISEAEMRRRRNGKNPFELA